MANTPEIVQGDDIELGVTLKRKRAGDAALTTFNISNGATVVAQFVDISKTVTFGPEVTLAFGATGADWANSLVVVEMTAAESAQITHTGMSYCRVRVTDTGKRNTYYAPVEILEGG